LRKPQKFCGYDIGKDENKLKCTLIAVASQRMNVEKENAHIYNKFTGYLPKILYMEPII
jgi:hypothetical protein